MKLQIILGLKKYITHQPSTMWAYDEWMNEWMTNIYLERLKAYKCMLNLPRLTEN